MKHKGMCILRFGKGELEEDMSERWEENEQIVCQTFHNNYRTLTSLYLRK